MLDIIELQNHILYNKETGACYRVGYRDCHGNLIKCNYLIEGKTRKGKYGYTRVSINGQRYVVHKLAYFIATGIWADTIDHIDGDCSNNKFDNLRLTTRLGNMKNLKLRTTNKTGHIGVSFRNGKYYAQAQADGIILKSKGFLDIQDAISARAKMNVELEFHENHGTVR